MAAHAMELEIFNRLSSHLHELEANTPVGRHCDDVDIAVYRRMLRRSRHSLTLLAIGSTQFSKSVPQRQTSVMSQIDMVVDALEDARTTTLLRQGDLVQKKKRRLPPPLRRWDLDLREGPFPKARLDRRKGSLPKARFVGSERQSEG